MNPALQLNLRSYLPAVMSAAMLLSSGCDREDRSFHATSDRASASATTRQSDALPGGPLTIVTAMVVPGPTDPNEFERNAFQLSEGQRLYIQMNCVGCHANGGGDIGPPLADNRWVYGATPADIFTSIVQGRPNGMPAYGVRLTQAQTWQLVAYVRSLSGMVPRTVAPARNDHLQTLPPPNSTPPPDKIEPTASPLPGVAHKGAAR